MKKEYKPKITVGELIQQLSAYDNDLWVDFSMLDFYRLKQRSPELIQIEFNQSVYRDDEGNVVVENHE